MGAAAATNVRPQLRIASMVATCAASKSIRHGFPVDATVVHDRNGQLVKDTQFFVRVANGSEALEFQRSRSTYDSVGLGPDAVRRGGSREAFRVSRRVGYCRAVAAALCFCEVTAFGRCTTCGRAFCSSHGTGDECFDCRTEASRPPVCEWCVMSSSADCSKCKRRFCDSHGERILIWEDNRPHNSRKVYQPFNLRRM